VGEHEERRRRELQKRGWKRVERGKKGGKFGEGGA